MQIATTGLLAMLAALLLRAAATDMRARLISNRLNLTIALLAPLWWFAAGLDAGDMIVRIGMAAGVLILFGGCFALGLMGGGDVKLLTALALWLSPGTMMALLFWMALAGGLLTLAMLLVHRLRGDRGTLEIPYGLAIVTAALPIVTNHILTTLAA
jgi:prepilin peptidase CpaA